MENLWLILLAGLLLSCRITFNNPKGNDGVDPIVPSNLAGTTIYSSDIILFWPQADDASPVIHVYRLDLSAPEAR